LRPTDRRRINRIGPRDVGLCLASSKSSESFLPLMVGQLAGATELHASRLGALATLASAGADQLAFELCEAAEKPSA
jgi:hypothetical protein